MDGNGRATSRHTGFVWDVVERPAASGPESGEGKPLPNYIDPAETRITPLPPDLDVTSMSLIDAAVVVTSFGILPQHELEWAPDAYGNPSARSPCDVVVM